MISEKHETELRTNIPRTAAEVERFIRRRGLSAEQAAYVRALAATLMAERDRREAAAREEYFARVRAAKEAFAWLQTELTRHFGKAPVCSWRSEALYWHGTPWGSVRLAEHFPIHDRSVADISIVVSHMLAGGPAPGQVRDLAEAQAELGRLAKLAGD